MRYLQSVLKSIAIGAVALTLAPAVYAQATRTWVSGTGDDANPCSRTAPCKTFAGAISKTAANGIINVLDAGGFGAVTITKSITIDGSGGSIAGVLVSGTNGININAPSIHVILRNLDIEGIGTGLVGVNFVQGSSLAIEHCRIYGFQSGLARGVSVTANSTVKVMITDTDIRNNGTGIHLEDTAGQLLLASLDGVHVENGSAHGLEVAGPGLSFATVRRSTFDNNALDGVRAGSGTSTINLTDSSASQNSSNGVNAAAVGARIRASGNVVVNNANGFAFVAGATLESDATNRVNTPSTAPNAPFVNQ